MWWKLGRELRSWDKGARGDPERSHPCDHPGDLGSLLSESIRGE